MSSPRPIEIIGGGLAGLSLGLALRRAGVPVTLFEAGDYPRHRVCGEFITGLASGTIACLGLNRMLAGAVEHEEVAWFVGGEGEPTLVQRLPAPARAISRHALDARLATAFAGAGGDLRRNTRVEGAAPVAGRVVATGRRRQVSPWIGLKLHARGLALVRGLELHVGAHGYVGLAQVETGAVNLCGLFRRRELRGKGRDLMLRYLAAAGLSRLAARVAAAESDAGSFCAVAAVGFDRRVRPDERMCLGDACAMVPPFTGNGMAMAFQSAEVALDPLVAFAGGRTSWAEATLAIAGGLRRRFRLRLASADILHPFLLDPRRQRFLSALNRARLVPLRPLYAAVH